MLAFTLRPGAARAASAQSWRPFVLVAGLLAVGLVANSDGVFDRLAARLARRQSTGAGGLAGSLLLVAVVTALLNLDTAVAFSTPVVVLAARRRGGRVDGVLYGTLFMANSASLMLPGSNLTNLLVFADDPISGARFAGHMWVAWTAAVAVTVAVTAVVFHRSAEVAEATGPAAAATGVATSTIVGLSISAVAMVVLCRPPRSMITKATRSMSMSS